MKILSIFAGLFKKLITMIQNKKTNIGLVEYCYAQLGRPYWYGTFGQLATKALYENRRKAYPSYYNANDFESQLGQKVHDCIGLVKGYFWTESADSTKYSYKKGFPDVSADAQWSRSKKKDNKMATLPEIPGVLVFMPGHVGVYVGGGWVIEARGHLYGVVKTRLKDRPWKKWAMVDELEYLTGSVKNDENSATSFGGDGTSHGRTITNVSCNMK